MKTILVIATALLLGTAQLPAGAAVPPVEITVTGTGSVSNAPNVATVNVGATTNDAVANVATSQNNAIYERAVARLAALGIARADVRTTYYNLNYVPRPKTEGAPAQPQPYAVRYGYVVDRSITVTVHDTNIVGKVVDACVAAGATNVNGVSFGLSDSRDAYLRALGRAVNDARTKAQAIAAAAHLRIVGVKSIEQGAGYAGRPMLTIAAVQAHSYAVQPTQIQPSNVNVQATVTTTYEAQ